MHRQQVLTARNKMEAKRKSTKAIMAISALVFMGFCSLAGALTLVSRDQQPVHQIPSSSSVDTVVTVKTTSGLLRGIIKQQQTSNAGNIIKFLAVPYAEAPIGALRFQRPQELKAQQAEQILNATKYGKTCPQYRHLTQFISPLLNIDTDHQTSEDCLQLNIFLPASVNSVQSSINKQQQQQQQLELEPSKQLPVIVWIPGEGFDFADARQFDGSNLALKTQSIVVTVQYRVGVLGFLTAPKLNITGNMGIYDQLMALRWVRKNIDSFGGDSERVTLMGRFSGSMSISTMITAPKHRELLELDGRLLFQRVALLSGIAVDDWIIDASQHERVAGLEEASLAEGYCTENQVREGNCLSGMPIEQLMRVSGYGWRLVKDNELIGYQAPIEAAKSSATFASALDGVLLGETGMEGTLCMYRHALAADLSRNSYAQLIDEDKLTSNDLYNVIRDDSQTYFRYNPNKTNPIELALGSLIETGETELDTPPKLREKYLNACSAYMIKSHSNRFKRNLLARNQQLDNRINASKKPTEVYHYELRYKPSFSLAPDYIKTAAHGDDIPLIFGLAYNQPRGEINDADLLMTRKMMSYIGNFVHGNQPLLAGQLERPRLNETAISSMDESDNDGQQQQQQQPLAINIKARSWANEGQLHHIEFDEVDSEELNARRRQQQQQKQSSNGSGSQLGYNNGEDSEGKSSVRADKSVNIRLVLVDSINQLNQQSQQQDSNEIFVQRRRQLDRQQSAPIQQQQQQQQIPSQQTNMTLINESSFVTMLLFGACLLIFALMSTCVALCLIIFRGNLNVAKSKDNSIQQQQQQHYVNSSTSSCNICEESQAVVGGCGGAREKDARAFSNVFAKLRNNQASQSHHNQQQQHPTKPIDGQSCKQQIE